MNDIIDPSQIQNNIVKIEYKGNQGTGFFVTQNVILTAFHTFLETEIDNSKIVILKNKEIITGQIFSYNDDLDICLIKTEESLDTYLPIQASNPKINENWQTFGFPCKGEQDDLKFSGTISHKETKEKHDFILNSELVEEGYAYGGLSGAPVVSNEKVIGIILKQIDDKLGAISIGKITDYLVVNDIDFETEGNHTDLPLHFTNEIQRSVKNNTVLDRLESATLKKGNWILMTGTPGSGKSLNIATFKPENDSISIIGKYFVKIPNDDKPKSLRISRSFDINVKGVFNTMRAASTLLADNGRIINFSSSVTRLMLPTYGTYSATKAAVEQLTRVFAKEVGTKGITVNSISPGPVNTELFKQGKNEEVIKRLASMSAFNRIGEPEDIAKIILFLVDDDSKWITGQNIGANGGFA
jgi:hypothetical protein